MANKVFKKIVKGVVYAFYKVAFRIKIEGIENIPNFAKEIPPKNLYHDAQKRFTEIFILQHPGRKVGNDLHDCGLSECKPA